MNWVPGSAAERAWRPCGASGALASDSTPPCRSEVVEADGAAALNRLTPVADLLPHLPAFELTDRGTKRAAHGNTILPEEGHVRAHAIRRGPAALDQ